MSPKSTPDVKRNTDLIELPAFLKSAAIATSRRRAHKLVHFADEYRSVWRRVPDGMPELVRIAATALCGRPIKYAADSPAHPDEVYCEDCVRVGNHKLLVEQAGF